ncbi:MAG: MFS transporter [Candidatus Helarchaeota archaeon]
MGGYFADYFGRKNLIILSTISFFICVFGILSQFFGIPLIFNLIIAFSAIFCIAAAIVFVLLISGDLFKSDKLYTGYAISVNSLLLGLFLGMISGLTIFYQAITTILLSIGMIIILILFLVYTKETLPSKEELEWKGTLYEFFCIASNGVCIFRQQFQEKTIIDADLFAGGLSGIISLVQEMTQSAKKTRIIDQEEKKILIEFGNNVTCVLLCSANLKILRKKLETITNEIEILFKDVFPIWTGNLDIFIPIGSLIEKNFT